MARTRLKGDKDDTIEIYLPSILKEQYAKLAAKSGTTMSKAGAEAIRAMVDAGTVIEAASGLPTPVPVIRSALPVPESGEQPREQSLVRGTTEASVFCSLHPAGEKYTYVELTDDAVDEQLPKGVVALFEKRFAGDGQLVAFRYHLPDGSVRVDVRAFQSMGEGTVRLEPRSTKQEYPTYIHTRKGWLEIEFGDVAIPSYDFIGVFTGYYIVGNAIDPLVAPHDSATEISDTAESSNTAKSLDTAESSTIEANSRKQSRE